MISKRLLHLPGAQIGASLALALLQTLGALAEVLLLPVIITALGRSLGLQIPEALAWVPAHPGALLGWMIGLVLVRCLSQVIAQAVSARVADRMGHALSQALYLSMFDEAGQEGDSDLPAQTLARLSTEGVKSVVSYFTSYVPALIQTGLMLVVALAVLLPVSPLAAGIVFLGMLLLPIASKPAMGKNVKVQLGQLRKYDQVGVHFEHALRGLNTLKIFGGDQRQADDLAEESEGFRRITMGVLAGQLRSLIKADGVIYVSVILSVLATVLAGRNTASWLLASLIVAMVGVRLFVPERQLVYMMHSGMVSIKQGKAIDDILQAREEASDSETANAESLAGAEPSGSGPVTLGSTGPASTGEISVGREPGDCTKGGAESAIREAKSPTTSGTHGDSHGPRDSRDGGDDPSGIHARNLTYTYPDGFRALTDLTFDLPSRGHVGLVGASGSGKSTLASLLSGRLRGYAGDLCIGGHQVWDLSRQELVAMETMVQGTDRLFAGTIRSNLDPAGLGYSDEELLAALEQVDLTGLVGRKGGLDGPIDPEGGNLSGGQRQRLSIARGLLRHSSLYVFDEATSAVDRDHDANLAALMDGLGQESLVLTVTHRLAGVRRADSILFLEEGRLAERGDFQELMDAGGRFAAQWKEQARYEDPEEGAR